MQTPGLHELLEQGDGAQEIALVQGLVGTMGLVDAAGAEDQGLETEAGEVAPVRREGGAPGLSAAARRTCALLEQGQVGAPRRGEEWVGPLLAKLDDQQRRALARNVARDLRRRQRERIRAQTNPDGTPYAPRKEQRLRAKQGSINEFGRSLR